MKFEKDYNSLILNGLTFKEWTKQRLLHDLSKIESDDSEGREHLLYSLELTDSE